MKEGGGRKGGKMELRKRYVYIYIYSIHPELRMEDCRSGTGSAVRQCRGTAGGSLN